MIQERKYYSSLFCFKICAPTYIHFSELLFLLLGRSDTSTGIKWIVHGHDARFPTYDKDSIRVIISYYWHSASDIHPACHWSGTHLSSITNYFFTGKKVIIDDL